jgi:hypothetical protein
MILKAEVIIPVAVVVHPAGVFQLCWCEFFVWYSTKRKCVIRLIPVICTSDLFESFQNMRLEKDFVWKYHQMS